MGTGGPEALRRSEHFLEESRELPAHMRINWFSPLPPARTGIAVCTETLVPALQKRAELTLWTDQQEWDHRLDQAVSVRHFDPQSPPWHELNAADISFYNIGNNTEFHAGIWEFSRRHAGVMILHDICLQHFFAGIYLAKTWDPEEYRRLMRQHYGEDGGHAADEVLATPRMGETLERLSSRFPLTPLALENSLGAVIHNSAGFQMLTSQPQVPAFYLPLPYSGTTATHPIAPVLKGGPKPPYRLIISGYIAQNRRLEAFLEAWAGMPEKAAFRLRICGPTWDTKYVESRITELGLKDLSEVRGYMSVENLKAELKQADLAVNLRYPTMGEASLTQLMIWEQALPALVTEVGWYATLPRTTVAFVRPDHESEDIVRQLRAFLENPQGFAQMGCEGYQVLQREHAPDRYAEALLALADSARGWTVRDSRLRMAARAGDEMRHWITAAASDALTESVARAIWDISGNKNALKKAGA
jgi:glycosyltransferase involved in cell wall biosynthesis